jgi:hypothetical protein
MALMQYDMGLRQKYWYINVNSIDRIDFSFYNLYAV